MIFEEYVRDWLERQEFSKNIRRTTRLFVDYFDGQYFGTREE